MLKTLIKKQYQECFRSYFVNPKTGKRRTKGGIIGMFVFFTAVMLFLAGMFFGLAFLLGDGLIGAGMQWLYFVLMGILSVLMGAFGSVFNTYAALYLSKDNEMLLAMPIPPSQILLTRMSLVYGMSLMYSGIVWIPALIYAWIFATVSVQAVVFQVLLIFLIALFVTVITCVLGWVVALIASRVKNRSFVIVVISLVLFAGYYYVCLNMMSILQKLLMNAEALGEGIRVWANVFYQLGKAAAGDGKAMLIFSGITLILYGICFFLLSRSFLHIATRSHSESKKAGKLSIKSKGASSALLTRELRRFASSPTYMLNCGLGIVILPVMAIFALVKREVLDAVLTGMGEMLPWIGTLLPMAVVVIVCMCSGLNAVSTPSISLEGKYLWILHTLPVSGKMVLRAKLRLHLWLNLPAALFAAVVLGICLKLEAVTILLCCLFILAFLWLTGAFGLMLGVLRPNFQWTSEAMPIKQSLNVMISILLGFALPILAALCCYWTRNLLSAEACLGLGALLQAAAALGLTWWLNTKGGAKFETL
ncbi:MAG: hypothetical protein SO355_05180 [Candidatus Faecousia sp.]|nr:hypothetical protein [Candidatus Faecousia sp.]